MGTNIEIWIEGKDKKGNWFIANPRYVHFSNPNKIRLKSFDVVRNYFLFAALSNVRNEHSVPYIQENRGMPKDASEHIKTEAELSEGSFLGYVYATELKEYYHRYVSSENDYERKAAMAIYELYNQLFQLCFNIFDDDSNDFLDVKSMRIIFWYDY